MPADDARVEGIRRQIDGRPAPIDSWRKRGIRTIVTGHHRAPCPVWLADFRGSLGPPMCGHDGRTHFQTRAIERVRAFDIGDELTQWLRRRQRCSERSTPADTLGMEQLRVGRRLEHVE